MTHVVGGQDFRPFKPNEVPSGFSSRQEALKSCRVRSKRPCSGASWSFLPDSASDLPTLMNLPMQPHSFPWFLHTFHASSSSKPWCQWEPPHAIPWLPKQLSLLSAKTARSEVNHNKDFTKFRLEDSLDAYETCKRKPWPSPNFMKIVACNAPNQPTLCRWRLLLMSPWSFPIQYAFNTSPNHQILVPYGHGANREHRQSDESRLLSCLLHPSADTKAQFEPRTLWLYPQHTPTTSLH